MSPKYPKILVNSSKYPKIFWNVLKYQEVIKTQKNNLINKFYFCLNFSSYRFEPNSKKRCDSNKSQIIFSRKDSLRFDRFKFLKINSLMAETIKTQFSKTKFL